MDEDLTASQAMMDYSYAMAAEAAEQMNLAQKCEFIKSFVEALAKSKFIDSPTETDPVTPALQALYAVGVIDLIFADTYDEVEQHLDNRKENISKLNRMMGYE